jgi:hypothetical protein
VESSTWDHSRGADLDAYSDSYYLVYGRNEWHDTRLAARDGSDVDGENDESEHIHPEVNGCEPPSSDATNLTASSEKRGYSIFVRLASGPDEEFGNEHILAMQ